METLEHVIQECHEVAGSHEEILKMLGLHEESTGRIIDETNAPADGDSDVNEYKIKHMRVNQIRNRE